MPTVHLLARAVIRDDDRVLVVQADGQSHTFLPGGHREPGESLSACLQRELREELGVEAAVGSYRGGVEHSWRREGERQYEVNHCFSVSVPPLSAESPPRAREDYLSFAWIPATNLGAVSLMPPPLQDLLVEESEPKAPWWASTLDADPGPSVGTRS